MFQRWQRRWFVLFDDGELIYSLDEHVSVPILIYVSYRPQNVWAHCKFLFIMVSIWSATAGEIVGIVGGNYIHVNYIFLDTSHRPCWTLQQVPEITILLLRIYVLYMFWQSLQDFVCRKCLKKMFICFKLPNES